MTRFNDNSNLKTRFQDFKILMTHDDKIEIKF